MRLGAAIARSAAPAPGTVAGASGRPRRVPAWRRAAPPAAIVAGAILLRLALGVGFANYDTVYSLAWGQTLARGQTPAYGVPLAPTPHPLLEALGVILAPLGAATTLRIVVALAFLALSWLGYLCFLLGTRWFSWPVGLAAAALLLSRYEILSYGARAYVDVPYTCLVLAALAIESRRRRAGWPVLVLLALAGLLRPEAWLFAGVYWLYLWPAIDAPARVRLALLVAAAPALWVLFDGLVTGHPLWSLTNTRSTARELRRATGIANVPYDGARRLGEVLDPDGLVAAALGGVLALWLTRSRALLGAATAVLAAVAFAILGAAGLPIQDRYVFLLAAILAVFGGAGLFGWRSLPRDHHRRRLWQGASLGIAVVIVTMTVVWLVPRYHKTFVGSRSEDQALSAQQRIQAGLVALIGSGAITARCEPISVPYATPVPVLALYLHTSPSNIVFAPIARGTYLTTATAATHTEYELDPDEIERHGTVPPGFRLRASNRSWRVYSSCG